MKKNMKIIFLLFTSLVLVPIIFSTYNPTVPDTPYQSNAAGWINNSQNISTALNVGIGTTNPTFTLDINGSTNINNALTVGNNTINLSQNIINIGSDNTSPQLILTSSTSQSGQSPTFTGRKSDGNLTDPTSTKSGTTLFTLSGLGHSGSGWLTASNAISMVAESDFNTTSKGAYTAFLTTLNGTTTRTEKMRITGSGNIGIGTATPSEKLNVNGSFRVDNSSGNAILYVNSTSGYVGIGTANPGAPASVSISAGATPLLLEREVNDSGALTAQYDNYGGNGAGLTTGSGYLGRFAKGTKTSPSDVAAGDRLGFNVYGGWAGGAFRHTAAINAVVDTGTINSTSLPTFIQFLTTSDGSITRTERIRISAAGNVGIGTTSPSEKLNINGSMRVDNSSGSVILYVNSTSGNMGIGTTTPINKFHLYSSDGSSNLAAESVKSGSSWPAIKLFRSDDSSTGVISGDTLGAFTFTGCYTNGGSCLYPGGGQAGIFARTQENFTDNTHLGTYFSFETTPSGSGTRTEKMRITGEGNIGIGTTSPSEKLNINGSMRVDNSSGSVILYVNSTSGNMGIGTTDSGSYKLYVNGTTCLDLNSDGSCTDNTASVSDIRFKTNITNITGSVEKIRELNGVYFYFNDEKYPEKKFGKTHQIGFIAQDVEKIIPEIVINDSEGYKMIEYDKLVPVLTEAIKEQQKQIDDLKGKNEELKDIICIDHPDAKICRE